MCIQRIRDIFANALYKSTFTYLLKIYNYLHLIIYSYILNEQDCLSSTDPATVLQITHIHTEVHTEPLDTKSRLA